MLDLHIIEAVIELLNTLQLMHVPVRVQAMLNELIEPLLREREILRMLEWRIQDALGDFDDLRPDLEDNNAERLILDREEGNLGGNLPN
jgi:hypothetical protein